MAGETPQFHKGRHGRLDSQNVNAFARTAKQARTDNETAPTPTSSAVNVGPGNWPIIAMILGPATVDNEVRGFTWAECVYQTEFVPDPERRAYNEAEQNYAVPLGVPRDELKNLKLNGAIVKISYTHSTSGPVLYFEIPAKNVARVDVLRIIEAHQAEADEDGPAPLPNCGGFGPNRRYTCEVVEVDPTFFDSLANTNNSAPSFTPVLEDAFAVYGYNLLEYGDADLGGSHIINECEVETDIATLPVGTLVLGRLIATYQEEIGGDEVGPPRTFKAYAFSVANDTCVQCCLEDDESGLFRSTLLRGNVSAERSVRRHSLTSINDEMLR